MESVPASLNITLDSAGRLDQDLSCLSCGYNLRGLAPRQICPECSHAVFLSILGDWLEYSDPAWVNRVVSGIRWILWSLIGGFIWLQATASNLPASVITATGVAVAVLLAVGYWKVTSPEPQAAVYERPVTLRKIARAGSIVGLALGCSLEVLKLRPLMIPFVHISPGACVAIAGWLLVLVYVSRLARRTPRGGATRTTKGIAAGLTISMTMPLIFALVIAVLPGLRTTSASSNGILRSIAGVCSFATIVLMLWSIGLLLGFRKQFIVAARSA